MAVMLGGEFKSAAGTDDGKPLGNGSLSAVQRDIQGDERRGRGAAAPGCGEGEEEEIKEEAIRAALKVISKFTQ